MLATPIGLLTDGVLVLREISPGDAGFLYRLRMDPQIRPMFRNTEVAPYDRHQAMLGKYFQPDSRDCWFVMEVGEKAIGTIALYNLEEETRVCECGRIAIAPESRGFGYGSRALKLVMGYARASGFRKLRCEILSTNTPSLRLFQGAGFEPTSTREHGGRGFIELLAALGQEA